jgi:ABC-2 type transport system ATP-binding protein
MAVADCQASSPLEVENVSAGYGSRRIFADVSFGIFGAEVFGLIGLNGVGKTTLIRCILGLRSAGGRISLFGRDSADPHARRSVIYLPEKFQPSPQLSGWEYLSILLEYFDQKLDRDRALAVSIGLDLDPGALDRRVKTYSKGMGQKLGLIGTFLADTKLMILDEPMSGLDPRARALLKDRLIESKQTGRATFFSSHILADIEEICDRIGVLHNGRIIFVGAPQDLIARHSAATLERAFLACIDEAGARRVAQ